jgi:hypothetical protein
MNVLGRNLILAGVVALIAAGPSIAGGLGDDHGEGNDAIFFGVVKDTRGVTIAGAHVYLKYKGMSYVATTDAIGGYRLAAETDADASEISCSKDGYRQNGTIRRTPPGSGKVPIEIDCTLQRAP